MASNAQSDELAAFYATLPADIRDDATQKCERARMAYRVSRDAILDAHDALAIKGRNELFTKWCILVGLNPDSIWVQVSRWRKQRDEERVQEIANNANNSEDEQADDEEAGADQEDEDEQGDGDDEQPKPEDKPQPKPKSKKDKSLGRTLNFATLLDAQKFDVLLGRLMEDQDIKTCERALLYALHLWDDAHGGEQPTPQTDEPERSAAGGEAA